MATGGVSGAIWQFLVFLTQGLSSGKQQQIIRNHDFGKKKKLLPCLLNVSRTVQQNSYSKRNAEIVLHRFLKNLHWLPIKQRIDFKTATLAYRLFNITIPSYLSARITAYTPRSLGSCSAQLLSAPREILFCSTAVCSQGKLGNCWWKIYSISGTQGLEFFGCWNSPITFSINIQE